MSGALPSVRAMLIDCDTCTARPRACGDCIVTHLLSVGPVRDTATPDPTELTESEVAAVAVLSAGGLVPPLRLVPRRHTG